MSKVGYWDSFDCEVQVEEVYNPLLTLGDVEEDSEDIMDRCQITSLDYYKTNGGSYRMEDEIIEEEEFSDLRDVNFDMDGLRNKFSMRSVCI